MRITPAAGLAAAILALFGAALPAAAQKAGEAWKPEGNVEFVVGAGAGGENDRIARAIQHALTSEHLVDSMTVLNRPGAAQTIAMQYLAGKKGDANAIGLASGSFINAIARSGSTLHKNITPLMKLFDAYQCYFTRTDFPLKTMVDVRDPGGHVDIGITSIGSAMPLIAAGRLRMLGIASPERLGGALASFPTLREQGLDVVTANSYSVLVPNGLASSQIEFWARALDQVLLDAEFKLDLERNFWVLQPIRYPETLKWLQDDYDENRAILKELGLTQ